MNKISFVLRPLFTAIVLFVACFLAAPANLRAQHEQRDDDEIRKIWDEWLMRKRQGGNRRNYKYRRVNPALPANRRGQRDAVVGITVWRLRPSRPDDEVRELLHGSAEKGHKGSSWTAERIEAGTTLDEGTSVRISIESGHAGYLYVINREMYADGTKGRPLLIFPTERTLDGNNRVQAGRAVTIPALQDDPPYFTVSPNPQRKDQVAELLLIIVSDQRLNLPISPEAQILSAARVNDLEKRWGAASAQLEQVGGVGTAITPEEFAASGGRRELTQGDPAPQTVYHFKPQPGAPVLLNLKLPFKRSGNVQPPGGARPEPMPK